MSSDKPSEKDIPNGMLIKTLLELEQKKRGGKRRVPIIKENVGVEALRIYFGEPCMMNVNSTTERGENPYLRIEKTWSEERGCWEIEIFFCSDKKPRVEDMRKEGYYGEVHPDKWKTFAEIVMNIEQFKGFLQICSQILEVKIGEEP